MRLPLVQPPYEDKVKDIFASVQLGPLAPLNFLGVLAHQPRLLRDVVALGGSLMYRSGLSDRQREIVILRVAARTRSNYEWAMHRALFAECCAIDEVQLIALRDGDTNCFSEDEKLLIDVVDELHDTSTVSDTTWSALTRQWAPPQLLEILVLVGHYHLVAFVMNATGARPEKDAQHLAESGWNSQT